MPSDRPETTLPLARVMDLLEKAYEAGARAREYGPIIPHEGWQHVIGVVIAEGMPRAEIEEACHVRGTR